MGLWARLRGQLMKEWLINREAVEAGLERPLTDEQWNAINEELEGRVDNFIEEVLDGIIEDIEDKAGK